MQTVTTAFQILEKVANRQPIGVSELARAMNKPPSSTHRYLRSLEEAGWVRTTGDERSLWVLTARAVIVARAAGNESGLREVARPIMERLRDETTEATHLAVAERGEIIIIERIECFHAVRVFDDPGQHGPSHSTANGKAILAFSSKDQAKFLLPDRLTPITDRTITSRSELQRELDLARERGWATAIGESRPDVGSVAAPILDGSSNPIASISVFFPLHRLPDDGGDAFGQLVLRAASDISKGLTPT